MLLCPVCGEEIEDEDPWLVTDPPTKHVVCPECGYGTTFTKRSPPEDD